MQAVRKLVLGLSVAACIVALGLTLHQNIKEGQSTLGVVLFFLGIVLSSVASIGIASGLFYRKLNVERLQKAKTLRDRVKYRILSEGAKISALPNAGALALAPVGVLLPLEVIQLLTIYALDADLPREMWTVHVGLLMCVGSAAWSIVRGPGDVKTKGVYWIEDDTADPTDATLVTDPQVVQELVKMTPDGEFVSYSTATVLRNDKTVKVEYDGTTHVYRRVDRLEVLKRKWEKNYVGGIILLGMQVVAFCIAMGYRLRSGLDPDVKFSNTSQLILAITASFSVASWMTTYLSSVMDVIFEHLVDSLKTVYFWIALTLGIIGALTFPIGFQDHYGEHKKAVDVKSFFPLLSGCFVIFSMISSGIYHREFLQVRGLLAEYIAAIGLFALGVILIFHGRRLAKVRYVCAKNGDEQVCRRI